MLSTSDIARLRAETPGISAGIHMNHSGASLLPATALAAIHSHLRLESELGPMEAGLRAEPLRASVRAHAAQLLNADIDEIALMGSGSSAFGNFFTALPPLRQGDRILVGRQEWGGNLATYQRAAHRHGARIEVIPVRADGSVDADALAARIDEKVRLISLTWLPANGGLINDAVAVGRVARAAGIPYFIDAGQALGQLPVDVRALQCDVLKGAGRKYLRGPRGTALLYIRRDFLKQLEPAWVDVATASWQGDAYQLREDARRFETSESPVALQLGLGASIELALSLGLENIAAKVAQQAQFLRTELAQIPGLTLHDLGGVQQSGLVSFNLHGHSPYALKDALAARKIYIGANGVPYTPLDMQARGLDSIARASVSYLTTEQDIVQLCKALREFAV
jgi:cysteine desulfurase/selenocysteine lyase